MTHTEKNGLKQKSISKVLEMWVRLRTHQHGAQTCLPLFHPSYCQLVSFFPRGFFFPFRDFQTLSSGWLVDPWLHTAHVFEQLFPQHNKYCMIKRAMLQDTLRKSVGAEDGHQHVLKALLLVILKRQCLAPTSPVLTVQQCCCLHSVTGWQI